jgi:hypothetical protein
MNALTEFKWVVLQASRSNRTARPALVSRVALRGSPIRLRRRSGRLYRSETVC